MMMISFKEKCQQPCLLITMRIYTNEILIDTGAFLARYLVKDQHHKDALAGWDKLKKSREKCVTSNFVLDETFTLLGRWAGYDFAAAKASSIYTSGAFTVLRPELEDELRALEFFTKFSDQAVSFTDCVSFSLIKKNRVKSVFTFDQHFEYAGFKVFTS